MKTLVKPDIMHATFQINMLFLQSTMPELYQLALNFRPKNSALMIDEKSYINIKYHDSWLYHGNPLLLCSQQVDNFIKDPSRFYAQFSQSEKPNFKHEVELNKLIQKKEQKTSKDIDSLKIDDCHQIDFLVLLGTGLGYHIEDLLNKAHVKHLVIYEPNPDFFYYMLHCIDLSQIFKRCFSLGGKVSIIVDNNPKFLVEYLKEFLREQGVFYSSCIHVIQHYEEKKLNEARDLLMVLYYQFYLGWGFFEDEIISISHTIANAESSYPFLLKEELFENSIKSTPVFLIANGPSLDSDLMWLKKNKNKGVVVSCGSSIRPLLEHGIIPNIHVEMERTSLVYDWLIACKQDEKLKNISLIALNTVLPDVLKLFKNSYLIFKGFDCGTQFFNQDINSNGYKIASCANPLVANTAVSAFFGLGFEKIYLFGIDCGYIDQHKHHSKDSLYYDDDFHVNSDFIPDFFKEVEGNFRKSIKTTMLFDMSRDYIEKVINSYPNIKCYNCSDGAKIDGAKAVHSNSIIFNEEHKIDHKGLDKLLNKAFKINQNGADISLFWSYVSAVEELMNALFMDIDKVQNRIELESFFSQQYELIRKTYLNTETSVVSMLLWGSINYFQTVIMTYTYCIENEHDMSEFISYSLSIMSRHFLDLLEELKIYYNKPSKV